MSIDTATPRKKMFAIASLVIGFVAAVVSFVGYDLGIRNLNTHFWISAVAGILALVAGIASLWGRPRPNAGFLGMGLIGIVVGVIVLAYWGFVIWLLANLVPSGASLMRA